MQNFIYLLLFFFIISCKSKPKGKSTSIGKVNNGSLINGSKFSYKGEDGNEAFGLQSAMRLDDGDWVQSITDITQVKVQQQELKRLSDGIEKLANPIFIWDSDNKLFFFTRHIVFVN